MFDIISIVRREAPNPEHFDSNSLRRGQIRKVVTDYREFLNSVDNKNPSVILFRGMVNASISSNRKANLTSLNDDSRHSILDAVRHHAKREFTVKKLNAVAESILENAERNIELTGLDPKEFGLVTVRNLFVGPINSVEEEFEGGMRDGALNVLDLLQGTVPLLIYRRDLMEIIGSGEHTHNFTGQFTLPTGIDGVGVEYSYRRTGNSFPHIKVAVGKI